MAKSDPTGWCDPQIDSTAYIAPDSHLLGRITIGSESSVWFGAVIRADDERIEIGKRSNVQDLCCLHADPGFPCLIGSGVSLGHGAIVHGAIVEDDVLIGMSAVLMNGARIGAGSIVAVGAVVTEGTQVPPGSIVMGIPGRVKRAAEAKDRQRIEHGAAQYVDSTRRYLSLGRDPRWRS
jgi:carbonic anhydrase/acetyltransferase-like protein (isoleucine patch superfamily)